MARRLGDGPVELLATESVDQGLAQLKDWLAEGTHRNGRLWLGGTLCQLVAAPAVKGVGTLKEAEAAVKLEYQSTLDFDFKLHECEPGAAQWRATLTDRRLIGAEAELWQSKLASMKPWWSWALTQAAASRTAGAGHQTLLAFDGETLVELSKNSEGQVTQARTQPAAGGREALQRQLLRQRTITGDAVVVGVALGFEAEKHADSLTGFAGDFAFEPWTEVLS
ncbi:hypothetical protein [Roseateles sp.]|uniref:hypothetical protein n=1 Tax=Roseateles sp. TaxID=1971397 RepID=UPI0039EA32DF